MEDSNISRAVPKIGLEVNPLEWAVGGVLRRPTSTFGPKVREPQETIQISRRQTSGSGYSHPFKISCSENALSVEFGMIYVSRILIDSSSQPYASFAPVTIAVGSGNMANDPVGGTTGTVTVLDSTTYGVWVELEWSITSNHDKTAGFTGPWIDFQNGSFSLGGTLVVSSTHTTGDPTGIMAANSSKSYVYVGRVVVDGSGVATIYQHLRSDLAIPSITLPADMIDPDGTNQIYVGTSGGLMVDP